MDSKNRHLLFAARLSLGAAALFAAVLAWGSGVGITTVCGPGACASALQSSYAHIAGVPFALLGLIVYVIAFVAAGAIAAGRDNFLAFAGKISCTLILVFALWLTALQFIIIGGYCSGCSITHLFGVGGAAAVLLASRRRGERFAAFEIALTGGLASAVMLLQAIGGGKLAAPPAEFEVSGLPSRQFEPTREADIVLHDGQVQGYRGDFPLLGRAGAENTVYALVDPTGELGRKLEPMLASIQQGFGDDLAVVFVPAAKNPESAAVQRTLLALWHSNRAAHGTLCRDLAEGALEAKRTTVEVRAAEVIGAEALRASYVENAGAIRRAMNFGRDLLVANRALSDSKVVPQLLIGGQVVAGHHPGPGFYVETIRDEFGIEPLGEIFVSKGPALELVGGEVCDIGRVEPGATREVELELRNAGGAPLEIGWLSLPHGCGVASSPRIAIGSGQGAMIRLRIRVPEAPGPLEHTVFINHNGLGKKSRFTLMAHVDNKA